MRNDATSTDLTSNRFDAAQAAREKQRLLDAAVVAGLSLPLWVLEVSNFAAALRDGVRDDGNELQRCFLSNADVLCANAAAVAFHRARDAAELVDSLERIFRPQSVQTIVRALQSLRASVACEHDIVLGALDGAILRARARCNVLTLESASCLVVTLLPDPPRSNLLRAIPDLAFELDANGIYVDFAGPAEDAFLTPREFLGKSITETLPPDVAHRALAALHRLQAHGGSELLEYALSMSDGLHWYEARLTALPSGGAVAYVRDVTERKSAEWRYQESEERLRHLTARSKPGPAPKSK